MLLANVTTKTVLDRWKGMAIAAGGLALMLLFAMAAYQGIDTDFFTRMPEAWRALMNIPEDADFAVLGYAAMYSSWGTLTIASLALSMGAASIAGEERDGTLGLLLANPRSRVSVLLSKAAAMVLVIGAGILLLWGSAYLVPAMIGADTGGLHLGALMLHMFVASVFFGALALAIGGWTGNRSLASGTTAGIMVISFIANGILPLVEGWERVAKAFPWYYYDGGDPLNRGVDWGHLAVLLGGIVVLAAVAVVGVRRRDLRDKGIATTMLDRLRANPRTRKIMERIAGGARVSRIAAKTISDHQTLMIVVGYVMVFMAAFIGPFYKLIDEVIIDLAEQFPDAIMAMIGNADLATIEGWYQTEIFSLSVPVAFMAVTIVMGAKALAGEEADRTMGLLLGNPVSRRRVVLEKAAAMTAVITVVGVLTFLGTMLGSLIGSLGMSPANVAATTVLGTMLALGFGAMALAIGAATGRVKVAAYAASGLALGTYIVNAYFPLSDTLAPYAKATPFYYYLTRDPLNTGMPWLHLLILTGLTIVLIAAAVALFDRRDLRQTG